MKHKLLSVLLVVALLTGCLGGLAVTASAAEAVYGDFVVETTVENGCSFENGVLKIQTSGAYTVRMAEGKTSTGNTIVINAADVMLKLDDVQIASEKQGTAALTLNYDTALEAVGEVRLTGYTDKSGDLSAGISGTGKTLTFTGGTLYAKGGNGMMTVSYYDAEYGYCGVAANVFMTGGALYATGGNGSELRDTFQGRPGGAGIIGNVTLHDGTMYATGGNGGDSVSGAGNGMMGISGTVTVNGGTLYAKGGNGGSDDGSFGGDGGAGIYGNLNLYGGRVEVTGGNGGAGSSYSGDGAGRGEGGTGVSAVFYTGTMSDGRVLLDRGTLISTAGEPGAGSARSLYGNYIYRYNRAFSIAPTVAADRQTTILVGASASNCWSASTYSNQKYASYVAKICYPIQYEQVEEDFYGPDKFAEGEQTVIPNPTKVDHHFAGWQVNGAGEPVKDLTLDGTLYTDAVTLTATWTPKEPFTFEAQPQAYTYNGQQQAYVLDEALSGASVKYLVDGSWTGQVPSQAGSYDIMISKPETEVYQSWQCELAAGLVIEKALPDVTAPTPIAGLLYDGQEHTLIHAGATSGGILEYSLDGQNWSETLPAAVDAGQHTVYYRVTANQNYYGVEAKTIRVMIAPPETQCGKDGDCPVKAFDDVNADAWYHDGLHYCLEKGIVQGVDAKRVAAHAQATRAQVVTMLWRNAGCPAPERTECPFTDVSAKAYYYKAMLWAVESGITNGTSATTFSPDAVCTRGQVVTMLWRNAGKPEPETTQCRFTDVKSNTYCYKAILWAVENGVTNGVSPECFAPDGFCTRDQIVTFLYRAHYFA